MTDKKISQLDAAATLGGTEMVEVVQNGVNVRTTSQALAALSLVPPVAIAATNPGDVPVGASTLLALGMPAAPTTDIVRVYNGALTEKMFRLNKDATITFRQHSAPADADLGAGDCALWFDQTNGAAKLMIKAKTANGTVATGSVTLT